MLACAKAGDVEAILSAMHADADSRDAYLESKGLFFLKPLPEQGLIDKIGESLASDKTPDETLTLIDVDEKLSVAAPLHPVVSKHLAEKVFEDASTADIPALESYSNLLARVYANPADEEAMMNLLFVMQGKWAECKFPKVCLV